MIDIVFYETEDGTVPVQEFLDGLTEDMETKLLQTISLLSERGYKLRAPYSKPLQDGIFELRAQFGGNISRVLYFFVENGRAILTHSFIKKTQKEVERAKRYREDYLKRKVEDELTFEEFMKEQMKDSEFRREYEALGFESDLARAVTEAREAKGLTRKQLAKMAGVKEKAVEDFEYVNRESTINLFHKLASVLGLRLEVIPA